MATVTHPLVVYYSRTGTTATVARSVASRLDDPAVERIRPTSERPYLDWLARSFVPGSTVTIEPLDEDPRDHDVVFLGTPKWTLSCPPVNEYLDRAGFDGGSVGLFMTYGGFDEERYARRLERRLRAEGADRVASLLVKRSQVGSDRVEAALAEFVRDVLVARG